jgi:hypothetical protein
MFNLGSRCKRVTNFTLQVLYRYGMKPVCPSIRQTDRGASIDVMVESHILNSVGEPNTRHPQQTHTSFL